MINKSFQIFWLLQGDKTLTVLLSDFRLASYTSPNDPFPRTLTISNMDKSLGGLAASENQRKEEK